MSTSSFGLPTAAGEEALATEVPAPALPLAPFFWCRRGTTMSYTSSAWPRLGVGGAPCVGWGGVGGGVGVEVGMREILLLQLAIRGRAR